MALHYHGTPITPQAVLHTLAGRHFCVSFARDQDIRWCDQHGQSVMLDNGAFSIWTRGAELDWPAWAAWAERWLERPTSWAVLPDAIDSGSEANDRLLREWAWYFGSQGVPVWHLDEPISRLVTLCDAYERVCFGSAGDYADVGSRRWHLRVTEAFDRIADERGRVPWIHMLRGMAVAGDYPFASVDSTDIGRNHARPQNIAAEMATRWDSIQGPSRWEPRGEQLAFLG